MDTFLNIFQIVFLSLLIIIGFLLTLIFIIEFAKKYFPKKKIEFPDKLYVVVMYRYGDHEKHSYVIGVCSTKETAKIVGNTEEMMRGGKYTAEIFEFELDQSFDYQDPIPEKTEDPESADSGLREVLTVETIEKLKKKHPEFSDNEGSDVSYDGTSEM